MPTQTVATLQMCSTDSVDDNLEQAADLIKQAVESGASLVVLPEMFSLLGVGNARSIGYQETLGTGKVQETLSILARQHHVWIVGGTIPLSTEDPNKIKAACLVYDHQGQVIARYDKIHLFDAMLSKQESYQESHTVSAGDKIVVVPTPIGKLGICVCFDLRFPEVFIELANLGAELIAVPAAFTPTTGQAHWEILMRCRALDCFAYVIGAAQSGMHPNGRSTHGQSMIVNPWGKIVAEVQTSGPGIAHATIDLKKLYEIRQQIPTICDGQHS